jgi:hypothetical protein
MLREIGVRLVVGTDYIVVYDDVLLITRNSMGANKLR